MALELHIQGLLISTARDPEWQMLEYMNRVTGSG